MRHDPVLFSGAQKSQPNSGDKLSRLACTAAGKVDIFEGGCIFCNFFDVSVVAQWKIGKTNAAYVKKFYYTSSHGNRRSEKKPAGYGNMGCGVFKRGVQN